MTPRKPSLPECKILKVRNRLSLNQAEFAARFSYSAMALSRWESGTHEPTSEAVDPDGQRCGRAGSVVVLDPCRDEECRRFTYVSGRWRRLR